MTTLTKKVTKKIPPTRGDVRLKNIEGDQVELLDFIENYFGITVTTKAIWNALFEFRNQVSEISQLKAKLNKTEQELSMARKSLWNQTTLILQAEDAKKEAEQAKKKVLDSVNFKAYEKEKERHNQSPYFNNSRLGEGFQPYDEQLDQEEPTK